MNLINHEASATLAEVLAFIDTWEGDASLSPATSAKTGKAQSLEIKRLRREAKYLELRLQQLSNPETLCKLTTDAGHIQWTQAELKEYRRYQKAKRTNEQLKALVSKRNQEIALLLTSQRCMAARKSAIEDSLIMESLTNRLRSLELNLDQVVAHAGLAHAESLTNRSLCKVDADMAVVSERAYCYPVRCSLEQADSDLLIHFYKRAAAIREANEFARLTKISHFEHGKQSYELRSKTTMRAITQPDRLIYLQSSLTSICTERLALYEDCIIIVRRSSASSCRAEAPPSESLLLGWHRIRAEQQGEAASRSGLPLKELVMDSASGRLEGHLHRIKTQIQNNRERKH